MEIYQKYKTSKIPWAPRIPISWEVSKGKWLFHKNERKIRENDGVVTCFRDGQVTLRKNRRVDGFTNSIYEHGYQGIRKGDLVIHGMDAFAGAIGISDSDGKSTPVYNVLTERFKGTIDLNFYNFLFRYLAHSDFILSLAKGIRERSTDFRFSDIANLEYVVPPFPEQIAIAKFLDDKTTQIDQAIAQKERMIELLKERKQIIIQNAVTKGLDPTVKMKDCGVEWIGEIPEHWEVKRLKYVSEINYGISPNEKSYNSNGVGSILINGPAEYSLEEFGLTRSLKWTTDPIKFASAGSLLFCLRGSTTGRLNICHADVSIGRGCAALSSFHNQAFLIYSIMRLKESIVHSFKGSTFPSVTSQQLDNYLVPIPPVLEQDKIQSHIKSKISTIEKAKNIQLAQIRKLKEYKTTLIDHAVTGKIKVSS